MTDSELCSRQSARHGLPLIGSAGCHDAVLAFELDPPWTGRLAGSKAATPALDAALDAIGKLPAKVRVLALEPAAKSGDGRVRVLWFARGDRLFTSYSRKEYRVLPETLPAVLHQLAETGSTPADEEDGGGEGRDLMVCTHGSRDACCGKFGFPLYRQLVAEAAAAGRGVRVWRCSHLGGHRFAPTLLDLPSGRMFGRVGDEDAAALLAGGSALLARVPALYRGRAALPEPAQIVESELWQQSGPAFERAALSWDLSRDGERWRVALRAEAAGGRVFRTEAVVERAAAGTVSTPASCGRDPETESPWSIVR